MRRISTKGRRICQTVFFISLVFLSRISFPCEKENFNPRLSIKLSGGLSYITGGSVNRDLKTYDNYLSEMTHYGGGEIKRLHYGSDWEGELRWEISSKFALSAGIGYFSGKNKSHFEFRGPFPFHVPINNKQGYTISPRIEVIPLKLGIYYTLPFRSRINLFLSSGLGYYFSRVTLYKLHGSSGYGPEFIIFTKEEKYDLTANGLGCYVGAGFEFNIANNLVIVLEVQGRYARTRLKGTRISSIWELPWVEEEGDLYIGERDLLDEGYGEYCPDLIVSRSRPGGGGFQNIRRAVLDLSGLAFRAGIRIKLF